MDRVAIWHVDWPWPVSFCVRWVSHPKPAVRDVSWQRSLLVIKYFAALYLTNGSSRHMVKIEHYTVLCRQRRCHGHIQLYGARSALGDLGRRRTWSVLELSQLSMCTE